MHIRLKRVYDKPEVGDGCRILVDRLWPRGVSKQEANISLWLKDIAPSTGLRKWFGHSTIRWQEFWPRYLEELDGKQEELDPLPRGGRPVQSGDCAAARLSLLLIHVS
jgi:uncharacterized protein YeaO (DUF488 family)